MISPERLRRFAHCATAPEDLLKEVAKLSQERAFREGEQIFEEGNTATHLMFLETGEVNITYRLGDDREIIVDTLVAGDTLCWSALLEPHKLTGSGVGNKEGVLIAIKGQGLRRLCQENPVYGYMFVEEIAKTLRSRLAATRIQLAASM
jgi:CRP-like cAMP-binding protein